MTNNNSDLNIYCTVCHKFYDDDGCPFHRIRFWMDVVYDDDDDNANNNDVANNDQSQNYGFWHWVRDIGILIAVSFGINTH